MQVTRKNMEAKQRVVLDALAEDAPLRDHDGGLPSSDTVIVSLLAECLCRLESVSTYIRDQGWLNSKSGEPSTVLDIEARLRKESSDYLDALGMTPRSRVRLGLDLSRSFDLAQHWAQEDAQKSDYLQEPLEAPPPSDPAPGLPPPVEGAQIDRTGPEIEPVDELDALVRDLDTLEAKRAAVERGMRRRRHFTQNARKRGPVVRDE